MPNLAHLVSVLFGLSRALQLQCEACLFELRIDCRATFFFCAQVGMPLSFAMVFDIIRAKERERRLA